MKVALQDNNARRIGQIPRPASPRTNTELQTDKTAIMTTISVISAGAMGSALASTLTRRGGLRVLTWLEGRTSGTKERARAAGMEDTTLETIANESKIILSVLPPSDAVSLAQQIAAVTTDDDASETKPIYCDLNAVAPETSKKVAEAVKRSFRYVDGCIIGGQPRPTRRP